MDHNHRNHCNDNGHAADTEEMDQKALDEAEERLKSDAIMDQVRVTTMSNHSDSQTFFAAQEVRVSLYHEFERYP